MSLRFRVLGSGSSGNATLIEGGETRILIDAGLGPRALAERLRSAGVDPADLSAVMLSHEHGDHARGAGAFSAKWGVPLFGSRGTREAAHLEAEAIPGFEVIEAGTSRQIGSLSVTGVAIPHDAAAPLGFLIAWRGSLFGHATDLGHIDSGLAESFRSCRTILIESNYDPVLLRDGPYPWPLKERIFSQWGHLSNPDVARYLERDLGPASRTVVLAHLSEKNNHPELVLMAAETSLRRAGRRNVELLVCDRYGTGWIEVRESPFEKTESGQLPLF